MLSFCRGKALHVASVTGCSCFSKAPGWRAAVQLHIAGREQCPWSITVVKWMHKVQDVALNPNLDAVPPTQTFRHQHVTCLQAQRRCEEQAARIARLEPLASAAAEAGLRERELAARAADDALVSLSVSSVRLLILETWLQGAFWTMATSVLTSGFLKCQT